MDDAASERTLVFALISLAVILRLAIGQTVSLSTIVIPVIASRVHRNIGLFQKTTRELAVNVTFIFEIVLEALFIRVHVHEVPTVLGFQGIGAFRSVFVCGVVIRTTAEEAFWSDSDVLTQIPSVVHMRCHYCCTKLWALNIGFSAVCEDAVSKCCKQTSELAITQMQSAGGQFFDCYFRTFKSFQNYLHKITFNFKRSYKCAAVRFQLKERSCTKSTS